MKKIICATLIALASLSSASAFAHEDNTCDGHFTVFDGITVKAKKHVAVCFVSGSYRYVYENRNGKVELSFDAPADDVKFIRGARGEMMVDIPNGEYSYFIASADMVNPILTVSKGNKQLAEIEISQEQLEDNIFEYVQD